jgi:L-iditol 2-dehydrogenase
VKAAVYYRPSDLVVKEVDSPKISSMEILIRVHSVGVCPTDLRIFRKGSRIVKPPVILGHEFSGEIVESKVPSLSVGERVNVAPDGPCLGCNECSRGLENLCKSLLSIGTNVDGAYAEFVRVPSRFVSDELIFKLPHSMSYEEGALVEPVAASIHALGLTYPQERDNAVIVGDGPNALIHLQLLKNFYSVKSVTMIGLLEHRLEKARRLGADEVILAEELLSHAEKLKQQGVDIIDLTIGNSEALKEATSLMTAGSRLVFFGGARDDLNLPVTLNQVHYNQFSITGSSGTTIAEYSRAFELVSKGSVNLGQLITHSFSLDDIMMAFETVEKSMGLKVIVNP